MYNKLLDTFLWAASLGSFSKAAEQLHISSTAVVKQINQLEDELHVRLFHRTSRGVILTEAGRALEEESKKLIAASEVAVRRVRQIEARASQQVRLGTSILRPAGYFFHLWADVCGKPLTHRVVITPFLDNTFTDYLKIVNSLGREIDIIATAYHPDLEQYKCKVLEITKLPFCCAVPAGHPLESRRILEVSDLIGSSILILARGLSVCVDEARAELLKYPGITLIDTPDYEPQTFNRSDASNQLLLTLECWSDAHPLLTTIPINWSYGAPYGLLYSQDPSPDTQAFIDFVKHQLPASTPGRFFFSVRASLITKVFLHAKTRKK